VLLSIRELELHKIRFDVTYPPGEIEFSESGLRQVAGIRAAGVAELVGPTHQVRVRGHISGAVQADCHRCLEAVSFPLDGDFDLYYRPADLDSDEPNLELDPAEAEIGYYEGAGLQLADVLREQILLWLPMQWVCREDCKGICPVCGQDRNRVCCDCRSREVDDRWAALRTLSTKEQQ